MRELSYTGKSKDVYDRGNGLKEFVFTDRVSAMDRNLPDEIPDKGRCLCDISCFWFNKFNDLGVSNHFVERISDNSILVKSINIIRDYSKIIDGKTNHLIPLEFITRSYVAGSLYQKLLSGELRYEDYNLKQSEIVEGFKLPINSFEITTKLEKVDIPVDKIKALKMSGMNNNRLDEIRGMCFKIDKIMEDELSVKGLIHIDGKKEFGYDTDGNLMLVDVCGTPDEDRFRLVNNTNSYIDLSKEILRKYLRKTEFYKELVHARKQNLKEPEYPLLSENIIKELSCMYKQCRDIILS